ncbi:MAG: prephenate dehydratase domain-containing protein [Bacteroidota bacterium]
MDTYLTATKTIAIQGVSGSFHEIAARKFFGEAIELSMCNSFPALFDCLEEGKADYGVMAIENTVAGTLLPNYALLRNSQYRVIGEIYLRIQHNLMSMPGQRLEALTEVHSHPMALQQCKVFLKQHPHIRLIEREDTAGSAEWIQQGRRKGVAAIASTAAARHFELEVLAAGIEDNPLNFTRFLVLAPEDQSKRRTQQADKASLCFSLGHEVGCLSQVLLILSAHGLNLSKIQSLPIVGRAWEYFFHVDLEFEQIEQFERCLLAIGHLAKDLKILGIYPRGDRKDHLPPASMKADPKEVGS